MKNKEDFNYVIVPLCSIKRLYTHPKTSINDIFDIGIKSLADRVKTDFDSSIRQVLYCYYRNPKELTKEISDKLNYLTDEDYFYPDEDYNGFSYEEFYPGDEITQIKDYITETGDHTFEKIVCEFNRIRSVKSILNIAFNTSGVISNLRKMQGSFIEKDALIMVKTDTLFNYLKNTKTQYEIDLLACYLGIRSIIGKSEFSYTTKEYIACRMIGVKSPKYLKEALKDKKLKVVFEKYSKRYHIDKILNDLVESKFIVKLAISELRRIYISTKLSLNELSESIYKSFSDNRKQRIKNNKEEEHLEAKKLLSKISNINN